MTIDEAIKNLTYLLKADYPVKGRPNHESIKLGREALKAIASSRRLGLGGIIVNLPGETED